MKTKLKFVRTTLLGGIVVVLPVAILLAAFGWMYTFISALLRPMTRLILERTDLREIVAELIVAAMIIGLCFFFGVLIRTKIGVFYHRVIEDRLLFKLPGYSLVKDIVLQFIGSKTSAFSSVALANIFGNETWVTAFVTDERPGGGCTVFVPTGPNPTSGNIYHLTRQQVKKLNVPVELAMRCIISCGVGSSSLIRAEADP